MKRGILILMVLIFAFGACSNDKNKLKSIKITVEKEIVLEGETISLSAQAYYENDSITSEGIVFSSSNEDVLKVEGSNLKAISKGEAVIKAEKDGISDEVLITVQSAKAFEKFESLNFVGTVNSFTLDESTKMKYMGDGVYEYSFIAPAANTEEYILAENANQAVKFVIDEDWSKSGIGSDGILEMSDGMGNIYVTLEEGKEYTIFADFVNMTYQIKEKIESVWISGTINSFNAQIMEYLGNANYEFRIEAPVGITEEWVTDNGGNQAIKFILNETETIYVGEDGNLRADEGYENIYISMEEGEKYSINVDFINMKYSINKLGFNSVSFTGTVNGFKLQDMKYAGNSVYEVKVEAPAPNTEAWVTDENANQAFKFVIDEDWNKNYVGADGNLEFSEGMGNIYVNLEQGKTYLIKADFANMKYSYEEVDSLSTEILIRNADEFVNIDSETVRFMFKATRGADAKLYLGESSDSLELVKEIKNYDFKSEEGFKLDGFEAGKEYFYKIELTKNSVTSESEVLSLTKLSIGSFGKATWAKEAVCYEIFVRSFSDGDGDGIGDFKGLEEKIPYLKDLGIDAIWLMPMNESPTYHGYDVINYQTIEQDYGGMEAFDSFLEKAHENGIKIIMDFVANHTADDSAWFQDALNNDGSEYKDFYVWGNEFEDIDADRWHTENEKTYYGFYESGMPDLNYRNPKLRERIKTETKFWIDKGIDGFRLDGADNIDLIDDVEQAWWKEFSYFVYNENPEVYVVGENNFPGDYEKVAPFFGVMQSSFNFYLYDEILSSAKGTYYDILDELDEMYLAYEEYSPELLDSTFTGNHDKARIISAIRNDSNPPVAINFEQAKQAFSIMMTLPGTPFFYYGEEFGQYGGVAERDENKREPMDWYENGQGAGMTNMDVGGFQVGSKNTIASDGISYEEQNGVEGSVYEHYKKLIQIRKDNPYMFSVKAERIGSPYHTYAYMQKGDSVNTYVVHNIGEGTRTIEIAIDGITDLLTDTVYGLGDVLTLDSYETAIFVLDQKPIIDYEIEEIELSFSTVKIILNAPANTPIDDQIFTPGSFNEWGNNDEIEVHSLSKISDTRYELDLTMEQGTTIEYKFVRGTDGLRDWSKDGLNDLGERIGTNFMYTFSGEDATIEQTVYGWLDLGMPE